MPASYGYEFVIGSVHAATILNTAVVAMCIFFRIVTEDDKKQYRIISNSTTYTCHNH